MTPKIRSIIRKFAGGSAAVRLARGAGAEFEMWLLLNVAARLKDSGYSVELRDGSGHPLNRGGTFALRGTPGPIKDGYAGYVRFGWKGDPYELHANVQFRGRSTQTHEVDIALIPTRVANALRSLPNGGRPTGQPRIALECKFKSSTGQKDEARQFIARQFDLTFLRNHPHPWVTPKHRIWPESDTHCGVGTRPYRYIDSFTTAFNAVCRIGKFTEPAGRFLEFNHVKTYTNFRRARAASPRGGSALRRRDALTRLLNELEKFLLKKSP